MSKQQPVRKVTTTYITYEDRREASSVEESKGCLEMLALLPFMGVIYYVYQIISNQ